MDEARSGRLKACLLGCGGSETPPPAAPTGGGTSPSAIDSPASTKTSGAEIDLFRKFDIRQNTSRGAAAFLLDSHAPGAAGGTGKVFDWDSIPPIDAPVVLAGGLTCENVAEAVRRVRPWAVDVSSGVEDAPGIKNAEKIRQFISEAKREN